MPRTAVYTNPLFRHHDTGWGHPESPDRLDAALEGVRRSGLTSLFTEGLPQHPDTEAIIRHVHSPEYEKRFLDAVERGEIFESLDNPVSPGSYPAAIAAVSETLHAADAIWKAGTVDRAFVIARPPGHHAERQQAMGFCFFNTIACTAEWLRARDGISRVFIFDWDVHHGNGTQHIFEARDDVFYASTHRYPFYPGTGGAGEVGIGPGRGFTRNITMAAGEGDGAILRAVEETIVTLIDDYRPDAILLSAGFDAHRRDPLGGMNVTEGAFGEMTRRMVEAAGRHCRGRLLSLLEGGYDAEGLAASVAEHLVAMEESG